MCSSRALSIAPLRRPILDPSLPRRRFLVTLLLATFAVLLAVHALGAA